MIEKEAHYIWEIHQKCSFYLTCVSRIYTDFKIWHKIRNLWEVENFISSKPVISRFLKFYLDQNDGG